MTVKMDVAAKVSQPARLQRDTNATEATRNLNPNGRSASTFAAWPCRNSGWHDLL